MPSGESNEDLQALLMSADAFGGPGILVPTSNTDLFGWCLDRGLRVSYTMTLMSTGLYARQRAPTCPASSTEHRGSSHRSSPVTDVLVEYI